MKIIRNKFIPFQGYKAIFLFGVLFVKGDAKIDAQTIRHETIHSKQFIEIGLLFLLLLSPLIFNGLWWLWLLLSVPGFYILYGIEWFIRLFMKGSAYRNISFEREAYANQNDLTYEKTRKLFSWVQYIKNGRN